MKVLMVCLGNICRSPMAEGILKYKVNHLDLGWTVDSAGTSGWHDGEHPDQRAVTECKKHGINISHQVSRKIRFSDFEEFDILMAMDDKNYADLVAICPKPIYLSKIILAMNYSVNQSIGIIPDPYYDNRFSYVYDLLDGCLDHFIENHIEAGIMPKIH